MFGINRERWAYFWCGFKSNPIKAVQIEIMHRKIRNQVRVSLKDYAENVFTKSHLSRAIGESDANFRKRIHEKISDEKTK